MVKAFSSDWCFYLYCKYELFKLVLQIIKYGSGWKIQIRVSLQATALKFGMFLCVVKVYIFILILHIIIELLFCFFLWSCFDTISIVLNAIEIKFTSQIFAFLITI